VELNAGLERDHRRRHLRWANRGEGAGLSDLPDRLDDELVSAELRRDRSRGWTAGGVGAAVVTATGG